MSNKALVKMSIEKKIRSGNLRTTVMWTRFPVTIRCYI